MSDWNVGKDGGCRNGGGRWRRWKREMVRLSYPARFLGKGKDKVSRSSFAMASGLGLFVMATVARCPSQRKRLPEWWASTATGTWQGELEERREIQGYFWFFIFLFMLIMLFNYNSLIYAILLNSVLVNDHPLLLIFHCRSHLLRHLQDGIYEISVCLFIYLLLFLMKLRNCFSKSQHWISLVNFHQISPSPTPTH